VKKILVNARGCHSATFLPVSIGAVMVFTSVHASQAQIFIANSDDGTVGEYTLSGTPINKSLISGLNDPTAVSVSGSNIFVMTSPDDGTARIGEYTISGDQINPNLITGLNAPAGMAMSGPDIFIGDFYNSGISEFTTAGTTVKSPLVAGAGEPFAIAVSGSDIFLSLGGSINEYTTSGTLVKKNLIKGLTVADALAVSGSDLFVGNNNGDIVGEYTTAGATVNADLIKISGGVFVNGITVAGSDLFVTNAIDPAQDFPASNFVAEYTTSGDLVNASLISGLSYPAGIAVIVPEPATPPLLLLAGFGMMLFRMRRTSL